MSVNPYPGTAVALGSMAGQNANAVAITGGTISNVTLPLGSMAQQDASAVAITGGTATLANVTSTSFISATTDLTAGGNCTVNSHLGVGVVASPSFAVATGSQMSYFGGGLRSDGPVGIYEASPNPGICLTIGYAQSSRHGIILRTLAGDAGAYQAMQFWNAAGGSVGSITTTGSATAYNTSSDVRLKHAITALTGALDRVRALKPVSYLWNANNEPGEGFLAHELMREVPLAVTGEPDAVDAEGNIQPQGVDHSKLVPWLVAALQESVAQVQALTARVASLEAQLLS